jgi:hypothetical protein
MTPAKRSALFTIINNFTRGGISRQWGAVLHSLAGPTAVLVGGFKSFEKIMKVLNPVDSDTHPVRGVGLQRNRQPTVTAVQTVPSPASWFLRVLRDLGGEISICA